MAPRSLTIGIDARLRHGDAGGVESVIVGIAQGLSALDGPEKYLFLTLDGQDDWIRPYLSGRTTAMPVPDRGRTLRRLRPVVQRIAPAIGAIAGRYLRASSPPASDGAVERAGVQVMHFAHQWGFITRVPSVYQPHDLQHRHLPEMFDGEEVIRRDRWYSTLCRQASMVAVASTWTRHDVMNEYAEPPEKVRVVPMAPPLMALTPARVDAGRGIRKVLPERYVLYPAQTWPHKNHVALLQALAVLRSQRDITVPLVLTGKRTPWAARIDEAIQRLGLAEQVISLGFIEAEDLVEVYRQASGVVIPSKFEAASAPLWEAFAMGIPVACSDVTSLPTQAGDAAMLFDPDSVDDIASAIYRLWTQRSLVETLVRRGRIRVSAFTWSRTARIFRAHYRRLAGNQLDVEDLELISEDPGI